MEPWRGVFHLRIVEGARVRCGAWTSLRSRDDRGSSGIDAALAVSRKETKVGTRHQRRPVSVGRIVPRLLATVLAAQALAGCDGIADFFLGTWDPKDPPAIPYIAIVETPGFPGDAGGATPNVHAEVVAGGVGGPRFVALYAPGALLSPIGREGVCMRFPDQGTLPISLTTAGEAVEVWAALVTSDSIHAENGGATDSAADNDFTRDAEAGAETTDANASDASASDAGEEDAAPIRRPCADRTTAIGTGDIMTSECVAAVLRRLCGVDRLSAVAYAGLLSRTAGRAVATADDASSADDASGEGDAMDASDAAGDD